MAAWLEVDLGIAIQMFAEFQDVLDLALILEAKLQGSESWGGLMVNNLNSSQVTIRNRFDPYGRSNLIGILILRRFIDILWL